ncbi:DNA repair protein RecN [Ligilactobacillus ceti]|uniref:DNA repair protein RecN n=1 Tax=Ligilactobacillus ceti DSM 22408 TaxID=1122146 RepID=A0A0R2KH03_9LACO|nr:DNA repair protein RecN [Ligilactobacillus ceti]KRN88675.1 DNA repair protein RecN [Ligilactobacillus ceti DSM 22408]
MLQELTIRDFAIIEKMNIDFESQMTVLTGETGAGKSIIIDALGLLAGGRGSSEYIRKGAKKAIIQGFFVINDKAKTQALLAELGIDNEADGLILERDLYQSGRNICRINGVMVNLSTLRRVGESLIDIHGQNEHQELMNADKHLQLLDDYSLEIMPVKAAYLEAFAKYQKAQKALAEREKNEKAWAQRLDMLQFQVEEIEAAMLNEDEEAELQAEKKKLDNYQVISAGLNESHQILAGETQDVVGQLGYAMSSLEALSDLSDEFKQIYEKVSESFYNLQDVTYEISNELSSLEWDEERLDEVEQRLELIHQLKRKYGNSIPQILQYLTDIKQELDDMQATETNAKEQADFVAKTYQEAAELARELTQLRQKTAQSLVQAVHQQLSSLYMEKAIFEVRFQEQTELTKNGFDQVEFYIQTNPGELMGPLVKIASGGELSRIMLALKTIFAQQQGITSIIFDEVDTGVSGRVAQSMAEKISQIAQHSQVLCITHLPQVAAIANHHIYIVKEVINGRTETKMQDLNQEERILELARLLSGSKVTELTISHAKEMLKMAQN